MKYCGPAIFLAVLLCALLSPLALAQDYPAPNGYVNDFSGLISAEAKARIEDRLINLEKDTSVEVAVAIIDSLNGDPIEDYASGLFEEWGIGKKGQDNGVLFLVAWDDRKTRIEVGYGIEGVITDARAGRILDQDVIPQFKNNDIEEGITAGVTAIENYVREGTPPSAIEENPVNRLVENFNLPMQLIIGLAIATTYVLGFMARTKSIWLGGIWGLILGITIGLGFGHWLTMILFPLGLGAFGTLLDILLSRNYQIRSSSGRSTGWFSSRGGFSGGSRSGGFGGGRSGGGGASRGW
jgi:uncharacterized protein